VPQGRAAPDAAVIVATVRAMKMNGGVAKADLGAENVEAVQEGLRQPRPPHREREKFGVPVVVAINHFVTDTEAEVQAVKDYVAELGVEAILCKHWAKGSEGTEGAGDPVVEMADAGRRQLRAALHDDAACSRRSRPSPSASTAPTSVWMADGKIRATS
jgi:formate--tetrahydrofolate ligase